MADLVLTSDFNQIAALLVLAAAVGTLAAVLGQPLVVALIGVGILAGPSGLGLLGHSEHVALLSELGVAVLLFLVGIKLDVGLLRSLGPVALITGLGQIGGTAAAAFLLALEIGLGPVEAGYVAGALTFSSTIIVVKLLSDRREIDALHGRIALGILIVQDLVVVVAMIALSAAQAGSHAGDGSATGAATVVGAGLAMLAVTGIFVRTLANPLTTWLARTPELLVGFALALAVVSAAVAGEVGLGRELGGLVAGIALASTPYREAIAARLAPLRDFLLLFFFVGLGATLNLANLGQAWPTALVLSLFVLVAKPVIVAALMAALGYRRRAGFLTGVTLAQVSEFSLVLTAMAVSAGHVGEETLALVTLVALVTVAASTYLIGASHRLFPVLERLLPWPERPGAAARSPDEDAGGRHDIILFGLGRYGGAVAQRLRQAGFSVLGVDFDPAAVRRWRQAGLDAVYGDALDPEFLEGLPFAAARYAISTIPVHAAGLTHEDPRLAIVRAARSGAFSGSIAVACHRSEDADGLRKAGADLVLEPFQDAADQAAELILTGRRPQRPTGLPVEEQAAIDD